MKNKGLLLVAISLVVLGFWDDSWKTVMTNNTHKTLQQLHAHATKNTMPPWKPGLLDIHHLHVGSSVSTFLILPDATTILVDAGEIDLQHERKWWKSLGPPYDSLKALDPVPNSSKRPTERILDYVSEFWPRNNNDNNNRAKFHKKTRDYLLATHFHSDHIGHDSQSGVPFIANHLAINTLIDRGYPDYAVPRVLSLGVGDPAIESYLRFVDRAANSSYIHHMEQFHVGSTQQVRPMHDPHRYDVELQIIKSGDLVLVPSPSSYKTDNIINATVLDEQGQWNENATSAAFLLRYGTLRYYEGGDQQQQRNKDNAIFLDTIEPTVRAAGRVDVASLNHHGHGVTREFVDIMDPPVLILQGWSSDQPPLESVELLATAPGTQQRQIFATHVFPERLAALGPRLVELFESTLGHGVVRAHPTPPPVSIEKQNATDSGQLYELFVFDGHQKVKSHHGLYAVRG